uniref:Uncharacterized protein n=2 Tax=unclassified Caudoviricetes TaxID=2788787 RepID=A0A8S5PEZ0_9CAUD|nr:MAG TPA: hypothetical protein [Caudovirales sp. ctbaM10]DAE15784.1 MAG TPA: hypothetical protein [Caudovirales sp. ctIyl37]DAJ43474.1 MAG TPA: hypothetical protein [Caudoviricetes sp.]
MDRFLPKHARDFLVYQFQLLGTNSETVKQETEI